MALLSDYNFKRTALLKQEKLRPRSNVRYGGSMELQERCRETAEQLHLARHALRRTALMYRNTVMMSARDAAETSNVAAVASRLQTLVDEIDRGDGDHLASCQRLVMDVLRNFTRLPNGMKYNATTKDFYTVLRVWGGPRLVAFVAENLNGPNVRSVKRWSAKQNMTYNVGLSDENFEGIASILTSVIAGLPEHKVGPVFCAGDETQVKKQVDYDARTDTGIGW